MWTVVFLAIMGRSAAYSVSLATDVNASAERRQLQPFGGQAYPGGCTSGEPDFNVPAAISTSDCLPERAMLRYPEDFGRLRSWVEHCVDEEKVRCRCEHRARRKSPSDSRSLHPSG